MSSYTLMRGLRQRIDDLVRAAKVEAAAERRLAEYVTSPRAGSADAAEDRELQRKWDAEHTLVAASVSVEKAKVAVASTALEAYVEGVVMFVEVDA